MHLVKRLVFIFKWICIADFLALADYYRVFCLIVFINKFYVRPNFINKACILISSCVFNIFSFSFFGFCIAIIRIILNLNVFNLHWCFLSIIISIKAISHFFSSSLYIFIWFLFLFPILNRLI